MLAFGPTSPPIEQYVIIIALATWFIAFKKRGLLSPVGGAWLCIVLAFAVLVLFS